jgi:hypothetical protein
MSSSAQSQEDKFEQLAQFMRSDRNLQEELTRAPDQGAWVRRVAQFAEEKDIAITPDELRERIARKVAQRLDADSGLEIIHVLGHSASTAHTAPF